MQTTVAIIGAGNFGTAVADLVASNGNPTRLWMRDEELLKSIQDHNENVRYLPNHKLHSNIYPTTDLEFAAKSNVLFVTVPSASFRSVSRDLSKFIRADACVISATKGVEADKGISDFKLMSQILEEELKTSRIGVLSGPNFAEEMAEGRYTGTVIASRDEGVRQLAHDLLHSGTFRVYSAIDVYGVELGGALKNVYAIIAGIVTTLELGQNTLAMVLTRSLAEMSRFAVAIGADPFTFLGLAGVGDLVMSCTSPLSRNFQLGSKLAQKVPLEQAVEELGKLAEGVNTLRVIHKRRAELDVYMPLVEALYRVVYGGDHIDQVITSLMTSEQQLDVEFASPSTWLKNRV